MYVPDPHYAVRIGRCASHLGDFWSIDESDFTSRPVKLDFAFFPQDAFSVEAHFESNDCDLFAEEEPDYDLVTCKFRPALDRYQQCLRFVYEAN